MDGSRFAALLRALITTRSRRQALGGLGVGLLGLLGSQTDEAAAKKKHKHKKRRKKGKCHGRIIDCDPCHFLQQCKCTGVRPDGSTCGTGYTCQAGACLPNPSGGGGPLVGLWREEVQFACGSGAEVPPAIPIGELDIRGDGTLAVTWYPFEVYHDYWATYVADLSQQTFRFQVTGGNYIPPDIDGEGHVTVDAQGRLLLTELWLGSPKSNAGPVGCGHRFHRFGT